MHDHHAHRSQTLHKLLRSPITEEMIDYVTWKAMAVIPCTLPSPPQNSSDFSLTNDSGYMQRFPAGDLPLTPPNPPNESENLHAAFPSAPPPPLPGQVQVPPLREFIANLVRKSRLHTGTFLATLVYLERLRSKLYSVAKGMPCTCHRVFLSTLIVTAKYVNDTSPKNRNWARYTSVFSVAEVNLMEKQLLVLLDFHLSISMDELVKNIEYFLPDENSTPQLSKYRPSSAECPDSSTCRTRPVHRYSMPAYLESGNLARSYLAGTSEDYPHECSSETVTPKLSDSSYSSDEYNEDLHQYSAPNSSLTEIVAPPPASYHPHRQGNITRYDSTTFHFSSNNPYRAKHQLEHKQYEIENDPSSSLYGSNVMSAINRENSFRNSRPRR